jgi:photosystem II stability/assembly factor-like uncharacterized protein
MSCWNGNADCLATGGIDRAGSTIMATADGGRTWNPAHSGRWLTCAGTGHCVVAGLAVDLGQPPKTPPSSEISYSLNGGRTWSAASLPAGSWGVNQLDCPTVTTCYAAATDLRSKFPAILVSGDGGRSWAPHPISASVQQLGAIDCSDVSHCVVEGFIPDRPNTFTVNGTPVTITTSDGGRSWGVHRLVHDLDVGPLSCADADDCLVVSNDLITGAAYVYASTDAGIHWHEAHRFQLADTDGMIDRPTAFSVTSISCERARCWVTGGVGDGPEGPHARGLIFLGNSAGTEWRLVHLARN